MWTQTRAILTALTERGRSMGRGGNAFAVNFDPLRSDSREKLLPGPSTNVAVAFLGAGWYVAS